VRALVAGGACICGCAGLLGVDDVGYGGGDGGHDDAPNDDATTTDGAPLRDAGGADGSDADGATDATPQLGPRIYVVGGARNFSEIVQSVYSAQILDDGSLDAWRTETKLPHAVMGARAVTLGGQVVAVFGRSTDGTAPSRDVSFLTPAGWSFVTATEGYFRHAAVATSSTDIYVLGGLAPEGGGLPNLSVLTFQGGVFGQTNLGAVGPGIWGEGMTLAEGAIYAVGGSVSFPDGAATFASTQAMYGRFRSDGTLGGAFTPTSSLQTGRMTPQLVYARGKLFAIGGFDSLGNPLASIEVATVQDGGSLSKWSAALNALDGNRGEHCAVVYRDTIYVLGGATARDGGALTSVVHATVDPSGALGPWTPVHDLLESLGWLGCTIL
jgi:hypothetical protein